MRRDNRHPREWDFAPDPVAATGAVLGLVSVFLPFLDYKTSRLATGTGLALWDTAGWAWTAALALLWLVCLGTAFTGNRFRRARAGGIAASLALVAVFMLAGTQARALAGGSSLARISPDAGIWSALAAAYITLFAVRRALAASPAWKWGLSAAAPAVVAALLLGGWLNNLGVVQEYLNQPERFNQEFVQHVALFAGSVGVGTALGVPLGILSARSGRAEKPVFIIANITQTIPSLVLFGLLIAPLAALSAAFPALQSLGIHGVGAAPAVIALTIYSLLPLVRNTYVGLRQIDPAVIDAGRGMGMSPGQVFRRLEIPLAIPLVMTGVRTAAVQGGGNAAVAALIGAGGLGQFIFQGLGQAAPDLVLLGALPIIALALAVDAVMGAIVAAVKPRGLAGAAP